MWCSLLCFPCKINLNCSSPVLFKWMGNEVCHLDLDDGFYTFKHWSSDFPWYNTLQFPKRTLNSFFANVSELRSPQACLDVWSLLPKGIFGNFRRTEPPGSHGCGDTGSSGRPVSFCAYNLVVECKAVTSQGLNHNFWSVAALRYPRIFCT